MAFQALYRRYRSQRFSEVKGQDHVVAALRNAVRDGTVAHAYLFSGPRGTGKTSTARILAKALNCAQVVDGEPCGVCEPCRAVESGTSLAVTELDAASNNGVEAVRDLIQRAALGTSGRTKVYIVDEVHMLSNAASNALLKTLEEPPGHVVFVLATTDPHKVLPTIRSRTQHYDFRLLPASLLGEHLRWVADDAGLEVSDLAIDRAVRRGDGSARDALSALDQIVAAGGEGDDDASVDEIVEGLCERDTARALAGVALACGTGADPRSVATSVAAHLRDALLSLMAPDLVSLPDAVRERVADQARRLGAAALVRALDAVGDAVLALPNASDPRVTLEVALVRVTRPDLDASPAALLERLERLERGAAAPAAAAPAGDPSPAAAPAGAPPRSAPAGAGPAAAPAGAASSGAAAGGPSAASRPARAPSSAAPAGGPSNAAAPAGAPPVAAPAGAPATAGPAAAREEPPADDLPAGDASAGRASARQALAGATGSAAAPEQAAPARSKPALGAMRGRKPAGPAAAPPAPKRTAPAAPKPAPPAPERTAPAARATTDAPATGTAPAARATRDAPATGTAPAARATRDAPGTGTALAAPEAAPAARATTDAPATGTGLPTREELTLAWADHVLPALRPVPRGMFSAGRFAAVDDAAVLALPNAIMRSKCEEKREELEAALADHFGRAVPVRLVVDAATAPSPAADAAGLGTPPDGDDPVDLSELVDAPDDHRTGIDRLTEAFPGAEVIDGT